MAEAIPTFLIAAPASGCGKTTLTLALLAALRRRELRVAPFKVGPDFIDPGHHAAACGRASRNLDSWMCGTNYVRDTFRRACVGADVAVIEGVMGLFDGASGSDDAGSSAAIARLLDARVLLVIDARAQARSAAALVQGFTRFDPRLKFAGILCNRVGSPRHAELLHDALASVPDLPPLLGCLPREEALSLPERHLGLVTAGDARRDESFYQHLAEWLESHVDLNPIFPSDPSGPLAPCVSPAHRPPRARIAVARDEAFCFYYPDNLELLEAAGAELVFFSPLRDTRLPQGIHGLYLGGGYPELHAEKLAANTHLLADIRRAADQELPIYAECGGFMLLSQSIDEYPMAGVFPAHARLLKKRRALGYREVTLTADSLLGPAGTCLRGHEFHYSEMEMPPEVPRQYRLSRRGGEDLADEGYRRRNVLGSYIHLHFGSHPSVAEHFVNFCRKGVQSP
ncbi:hydrogenobyrinic acid a,c-diamide synthase (glutamine-hydrolysing) [Geoalkalibacter ferrihydriticus]|uniref:Cobyrinate a,c-diamide synthase n=1 Tax=Geoalkalibacter ferrihydriticus TaxID=392333 RepID=A0A1G9I5M8_9BACT|nr:cobyrinate a,c-diamide synthase [Geoalkalibacter ferrihydriticus]SDL20174.1 hydrogenobyrinic acid a,c-diamide synthase (glutamine-hydrolysing) [Geoalkalibacter ferrihydriticus]